MKPPIAILTDFGTQDPFVGIMKGVILQINPQATLIDLTHQVPAGDIARAAIILWRTCSYFPKGTIFLTVVDPGVGTERKPVLLKTQDYSFIGPDNGVFNYVEGDGAQAWELNNPAFMLPTPGSTFHGRDIFAPAAAYVSLGVPGARFGPALPTLTRIPWPHLELTPGKITGEILHADHFGNLLTSLGTFIPNRDGTYEFKSWIGVLPAATIDLRKATLRLPNQDRLTCSPTFGHIPDEACAVLVGSSGLLEIAANRASAAQRLKLKRGDPIVLEWFEK
jgi:S-adenosylmethionine hydrolase